MFGRLEAFSFSVLLYFLGYIQMAVSKNVQTFAAAQIFYSAGNTGLQILQQIFIADTSDLLNRAFWSSLPDTPFLVTVWVGSIIGNGILRTATWRWGYGIWCIILPVMFLPLALTLFLNNRKAKRLGLTAPSQWKGLGTRQIVKGLWSELDVGGIVLLSGAFALILIPLTIASKAKNGWGSADIIAMLVLGISCFIAFPFWESVEKLAPRPLISLHLLKSRTFSAGCGVGFFYFGSSIFSISQLDTNLPRQWRTTYLSNHTFTPTFLSYKTNLSRQPATSHKPSLSPAPSLQSLYLSSSNTQNTTSPMSFWAV